MNTIFFDTRYRPLSFYFLLTSLAVLVLPFPVVFYSTTAPPIVLGLFVEIKTVLFFKLNRIALLSKFNYDWLNSFAIYRGQTS